MYFGLAYCKKIQIIEIQKPDGKILNRKFSRSPEERWLLGHKKT